MAATVMSRFSYPKVPGDSLWSMLDITGPTAYVPVVAGTPPTGGQLIPASNFGLQSIDWVQSTGSDNGGFDIVCIPMPFSLGNPMPAVLLMWVNALTGAQAPAGNLSARTVRLLAIGR